MRRRGVAMLMVLGASLVLLTLVGVAAASRARAGMLAGSDRALTDGLRIAASVEDAVLMWLEESSGEALVPAGSLAPWMGLMDSRLRVGDEDIAVSIVAWDQHGMLEIGWLGWDGVPGWLSAAETVVAGVEMGVRGVGGWDEVDLGGVYPSARVPDALGGLVATHRVWNGSRRMRGAINVNTAPLWLLHAAGVDARSMAEIRRQRMRGETVDVSKLALASGSRGEELVRLVGSSGVWSFRVDVDSARAGVSVWLVYARVGGVWVREQRVVIDR